MEKRIKKQYFCNRFQFTFLNLYGNRPQNYIKNMRYANFDTNKLHALNKFMNNIKVGDKKPMQEAILLQCHVSFTAYRKWIRGLSMPKPKNQIIINRVTEDFGYGSVYLPNHVSEQ